MLNKAYLSPFTERRDSMTLAKPRLWYLKNDSKEVCNVSKMDNVSVYGR